VLAKRLSVCYSAAMKVYHYPKCSTCRKALKWLDAKGKTYEAQNLVEEPPSKAELADLLKRSGLPVKKFFNTSGESYKAGGFKDKVEKMSEAEALAALAKDGKLIKRPIVDAGKTVLVGFDEDAYKSALKG
jgi:arsenate reductase